MKVTIYTSGYGDCETKEKYGIEHALGLKLLARGLEELYHLSYTPDQLAEALSKNEYGKPYLSAHPDIFFNISHTDYFAVCAFAACELGIDTEIIGDYPAAVFRKVFTADEAAMIQNAPDESKAQEMFARLWTLKESRIKEAGMGFSMSATDFSFDIDCSMEPAKIRCSEAGVYFAQQILTVTHTESPEKTTKYMISVCAKCENIELKFK